MLLLITGGSASGKSALAEQYAAALSEGPKLYLATMQPYGTDAHQRINRHRKQRMHYGFDTAEQYRDLGETVLENKYDTILVECLGNLTANEMFCSNLPCSTVAVVQRVTAGIGALYRQTGQLILVTNEVFGDADMYSRETAQYIKALGQLNYTMASMADIVVEVVCGLPIIHKGGEQLREKNL